MVSSFPEEIEKALLRHDHTLIPRFQRCLPKLFEATRKWRGDKPEGQFVMACATPNKSLMMWALAWTDMDPDQFPKNEVAKAAGFLLGLGPFAWELWGLREPSVSFPQPGVSVPGLVAH